MIEEVKRETYAVMDPLEQLCMMLAWAEDYTEEYKRERLEKAIRQIVDCEMAIRRK